MFKKKSWNFGEKKITWFSMIKPPKMFPGLWEWHTVWGTNLAFPCGISNLELPNTKKNQMKMAF